MNELKLLKISLFSEMMVNFSPFFTFQKCEILKMIKKTTLFYKFIQNNITDINADF